MRPWRYSCAIRSRSARRCRVELERARAACRARGARRSSSISSSRPSPVSAEMQQRRRDRAARSRARSPALKQVALVEDVERSARRRRRPRRARGATASMWRSRSGLGRVDDVQQQIRVGDLLERRAERRDERVRQPVDEPDRVRHEQLAPVGQPHLPDERIERHEQRVGRHRLARRQHVEQRRLAGVRVADERDRRHRRLVAPLAQLRAPPPDRRRSPSADRWMRWRMRRRSVSSLVSPGPRVPMPPPSRDSAVAGADQARQQVLQLRELDLQLAFARPRAPREDVEDELRAIDDLALEALLEVAAAAPASARCRR